MKTLTILLLAALAAVAAPRCTSAQDLHVFADQAFQPALQEILSMFKKQTGFDAQLSLGPSTVLADRILTQNEADVFFPASEEAMKLVMERNLVDVSLKRSILQVPPLEPPPPEGFSEPQYTSAAVMNNTPHRLQAMAFLEFLTSDAAREVFVRQGFTPP